MASAEAIADHLLGANSGRITAANLLDGLRLGHVDETFVRSVLRWWGEYALQTSRTDGEIGACMGFLCKLHRGAIPSGFVPPSSSLPNPHIYCKRPEGLAGGSLRASVRDAALVAYWATQDDLNELNDDALDLTSQPGQIAYEALANSAPSILVRQMRIANGKTLTNPAAGADAVFFFTEADLLLTLLGGKAFRERADSARDHLGLVHLRKGPQVAAAVFPSNLVEDRPDRGRPTAVDAGGNPRFLCEPSDPDWEPGWGRTADLTYSLEGLSGLPERICGPFPATTSDEIEVEFHLLGSVRLPRGDVQGVGDVEFADFLEARTARNFGTPLRDVLIRHLT